MNLIVIMYFRDLPQVFITKTIRTNRKEPRTDGGPCGGAGACTGNQESGPIGSRMAVTHEHENVFPAGGVEILAAACYHTGVGGDCAPSAAAAATRRASPILCFIRKAGHVVLRR